MWATGISTRCGSATNPAAPFPGASILDTRLPGNSNAGHEFGTDLSNADRAALIEYLKTL